MSQQGPEPNDAVLSAVNVEEQERELARIRQEKMDHDCAMSLQSPANPERHRQDLVMPPVIPPEPTPPQNPTAPPVPGSEPIPSYTETVLPITTPAPVQSPIPASSHTSVITRTDSPTPPGSSLRTDGSHRVYSRSLLPRRSRPLASRDQDLTDMLYFSNYFYVDPDWYLPNEARNQSSSGTPPPRSPTENATRSPTSYPRGAFTPYRNYVPPAAGPSTSATASLGTRAFRSDNALSPVPPIQPVPQDLATPLSVNTADEQLPESAVPDIAMDVDANTPPNVEVEGDRTNRRVIARARRRGRPADRETTTTVNTSNITRQYRPLPDNAPDPAVAPNGGYLGAQNPLVDPILAATMTFDNYVNAHLRGDLHADPVQLAALTRRIRELRGDVDGDHFYDLVERSQARRTRDPNFDWSVDENIEANATWGECVMCLEDPKDPHGCDSCKNLLGCKKCVISWYEATMEPSCPLCRERWNRRPGILRMQNIDPQPDLATPPATPAVPADEQ